MDALNSKSGQSLIELLIAIGIAGIFISGATLSVDVALRSTTQNKQAQPASQLAQELLDAVVVAARANWQGNIANPPIVLGAPYVITAAGASAAGTEFKDLNGLRYTRSFAVADVSPVDSSKKSITVTVTWPVGASLGTVTLARIVTRNQNAVFRQTDWSGGSGQFGVFNDATKFDTQSGEIKITDGGSIYLNGFSAP